MSLKSWPEGYKLRYLAHYASTADLGIEALRSEWRQVFRSSPNHHSLLMMRKYIAMKYAADNVRTLEGVVPPDVQAYLSLAKERKRV